MSSYLKNLVRVWKRVLLDFIVFVITTIAIAWWLGWKGAIAAALIDIFFVVKWWTDLKAKILNNLQDEFCCTPTDPEEFPNLNLELLCQYTKELESIDFVHLIDYKPEHQPPVNPTYFSRLFVHPQYYCFAEIGQVFPPKKDPIPMLYSIHSSFEEEWALSSTISKPNGFSYMWRSPRGLWTYHPSATPTALLQFHLEHQQQIVDGLGVKNLTDISWDFYWYQQQNGITKRRENFRRKNIVIALIEATIFEMKPLSEWMGDYPRLAVKQAAK